MVEVIKEEVDLKASLGDTQKAINLNHLISIQTEKTSLPQMKKIQKMIKIASSIIQTRTMQSHSQTNRLLLNQNGTMLLIGQKQLEIVDEDQEEEEQNQEDEDEEDEDKYLLQEAVSAEEVEGQNIQKINHHSHLKLLPLLQLSMREVVGEAEVQEVVVEVQAIKQA